MNCNICNMPFSWADLICLPCQDQRYAICHKKSVIEGLNLALKEINLLCKEFDGSYHSKQIERWQLEKLEKRINEKITQYQEKK